jgi:AcrR family transcriptional regulator
MAQAAVETRATRRRRQTEARLLDAALRVFCARGYDAATTAEMAQVADVAAGTFYLHFRDKRAAYERLAAQAAHDLLAQWQAAMRPRMPAAERVVLGLRLAADYWRADLTRARLLLEGGPSFGSDGHMRFVDAIATALAGDVRGNAAFTRSLALLVAGMGIELGRLIVARKAAAGDVESLIRLVQRCLAPIALAPAVRRASSRGSFARRTL